MSTRISGTPERPAATGSRSPARASASAASKTARLDRHGVGKRADRGAVEPRHVALGAERVGEVAGERPHIGALGAGHLEFGLVLAVRDKHEAVDLDFALGHLDRLAGARQVIGTLAIDADGREGRRSLDDQPGEARQQRRHDLGFHGRRSDVATTLAFGVVGRRRDPPA